MPRATNAVARHRKKKRIMKAAKGFRGGRSKLLRTAKETVMRSMAFATRDRKVKKRVNRSLWITRISAACKMREMNYSQFINGLKKAQIDLNRLILSETAIHDEAAFDQLVEIAKAAK